VKILFLLILFVLLVLTILPIAGQIYFGNKKLKGQLSFPFYGIHISAILFELILAYACTMTTINILSDHMNQQGEERICLIGATSFYGIGLLGVFIVQPLIALYFYIKTINPQVER